MEQNENMNSIEASVEELKTVIANKDAAVALVNSKDWKLIVDKLYFKEEAMRLVDATGNLALDQNQKKNIVGMMAGIPALKNFLNMVISTGYQAEADLKDYEDESSNPEEMGEAV